MEMNGADVDRRLEELQSQLDRLRETTDEKAQSVERRIEALIEHDRNSVREIHEQPVKELREHAASRPRSVSPRLGPRKRGSTVPRLGSSRSRLTFIVD